MPEIDIKKQIKEIAQRRYWSLKKKYGDGVSLNEYIELLEDNHNKGGYCEYCGRKLLFKIAKNVEEREMSPSIDHIVSKFCGGNHSKDNLIICCFACNVIKSNNDLVTFMKMLKEIRENPKIARIKYSCYYGLKLGRIEKYENINGLNSEKEKELLHRYFILSKNNNISQLNEFSQIKNNQIKKMQKGKYLRFWFDYNLKQKISVVILLLMILFWLIYYL